MYCAKDYISIDKEILSGNPVFRGTRVPIQTLFDHLEKGIALNEFLADFPSVKKEQAIAVLRLPVKQDLREYKVYTTSDECSFTIPLFVLGCSLFDHE